MDEVRRTAGDYTIIQELHIGDREIVVGENLSATNGQMYMCAFCSTNELFSQYTEILASDSYPEIIKAYGERVAEQAERTRVEVMAPLIQGIPNAPITALGCTPVYHSDDLKGKVVVIKPESLRREYRMATQQIKLCVGGFGAAPNSRGTACFCVDLYSGEESRFERGDILGTLESEYLPKWAELGLLDYQQKQRKKREHREEAR